MKVDQIKIDDTLLYLMANLMNEKPDDVIYFSYQLAMSTAQDFLKQGRGKNLNRTLKFFYKGNKLLPIKFQVFSYGLADKEYQEKYSQLAGAVAVEIKFNSSMQYINEELISQVVSSKIEKDMGLVSEYDYLLKDRPAPKIVANKNIRHMVEK